MRSAFLGCQIALPYFIVAKQDVGRKGHIERSTERLWAIYNWKKISNIALVNVALTYRSAVSDIRRFWGDDVELEPFHAILAKPARPLRLGR